MRELRSSGIIDASHWKSSTIRRNRSPNIGAHFERNLEISDGEAPFALQELGRLSNRE